MTLTALLYTPVSILVSSMKSLHHLTCWSPWLLWSPGGIGYISSGSQTVQRFSKHFQKAWACSLALARLITWIHSHVPTPYQSGLRPIGSQYEKSKNDRANQWLRFNRTVYRSHWLARSFFFIPHTCSLWADVQTDTMEERVNPCYQSG